MYLSYTYIIMLFVIMQPEPFVGVRYASSNHETYYPVAGY